MASAFAASLLPAAQAAGRVDIMVGGINKIIYLPAMLTERLGYFKQEGLDVRLLSEPAGVNAESEMLAGAVQGVVGFYDHTLDLQSKGRHALSVVQLAKVPGEVELVAAHAAQAVRAPADFRGQTLGITGMGSSTEFLTRYMAGKAGLKPDDYSVLAVGAGNTFIAAMQQKRIAAGMTTDPTAAQMLASGQARLLVDLRTEAGTRAALGGLYPAAALYMPSAWVETHKDEVTRLARAFVRTLRYMQTHSAEQIAAQMPRDYYGANRELYVEALRASLPMFTADGRMPEGGPETVLKVLSTLRPAVARVDLARTYTTAFVDAAAQP
jgi:NitT/TauT family transport system substrate-binding protein